MSDVLKQFEESVEVGERVRGFGLPAGVGVRRPDLRGVAVEVPEGAAGVRRSFCGNRYEEMFGLL